MSNEKFDISLLAPSFHNAMNLKLIESYDHNDGWTVFFRDEATRRWLVCRVTREAMLDPVRFAKVTAFDVEGFLQRMLDPVNYDTEEIVALVKAANLHRR